MSSSPTLAQVHFRVRTDTADANTGTPTWAAAEDATYATAVETTFRIRFCVQNTGTGTGTGPMVLRVSKNGGAYTAVTTTSGATLGAQSADASTSANGATIIAANFRLTAGSGSAVSGGYDEVGSQTYGLTLGSYTELEYGLILKTAGAVPGDTFDFRLYNNTTAFATYSQTPRVTVPQSGTNFQPILGTVLPYLTNGSAYNPSGNTTLNFAVNSLGTGAAIDDLIVLAFATDNATTTNADPSAITSVVDFGGNTYAKAAEWQFGSPGVGAGTTCGIWYSRATSALSPGGGTINVTFTSTADRDAVALIGIAVRVPAGKEVSVEATNTATGTGTTLASLNATTGNIECLRVRIASLETNAVLGFATKHTSGWTTFSDEQTATSGTAATSQSLIAEYRISTGTGAASAPSAFGTSTDNCSVYVAFKAALPNHACLANDVVSTSTTTDTATVLIHADGADASLVFTDAAGGHTVTRIANVQVDDAQSKFGGTSALCSGTGSSGGGSQGLVLSGGDLSFGTGDFTFDCWVRVNSWPLQNGVVCLQAGPLPAFSINLNYQGTIYASNGTTTLGALGSFPTSVWVHVAVTRISGSARMFVDGVQTGATTADSSNYTSSTIALLGQGTGPYGFSGWVDEIRVIKGRGAWSANFTPPTAPYSVARLGQIGLQSFQANGLTSTSSVSQPDTALGTVTSTAPSTHLVTSFTPGGLRNDHTGEVGYRFLTTSTPTYNWIGLRCDTASGIQRVSLYDNSAGTGPLRTVAMDFAGKTVGVTYWTPIPSVTLTTGTNYWLQKSTVSGDGEFWANAGTTALDATVSTSFATAYRNPGGSFIAGAASSQYVGIDLGYTATPNDACLANDVISASSVTQPAVQQRHNPLANDVLSPSSVTKPTQLRQLQGLLANDVISPSSVKQATAVIRRDALANDVLSPSSVTTPAVQQRQSLLANDILSPSSVTTPVTHQSHNLNASDVLSGSSVSNPAVVEIPAGAAEPGESLVNTYTPGTNRNDFTGQVGVRIGIGTADIPINWIGIRSNGIGGTRNVKLYEWFADSLVSSATIDLTGKAEGDWVWAEVAPFTLLANGYYALLMDVTAFDGQTWRNPGPVTMDATIVNIYDSYRVPASALSTGGSNASFVGLDLGWDTVPDTEDNPLANDITSASLVTKPVLLQRQTILANDLAAQSSVTQPLAAQRQGLLANDALSPASVTKPTLQQRLALLANDVTSPSSVTKPTQLRQVQTLLANDALSPSSVTRPVVGLPGQTLANDIVSQSSVTRPTLAIVGAPPVTVPSPVPPAHGGGAGYIGAKQKQILSELIEVAYKKALKIKEPEVVEAIREAVREAIPERPVRRLRTEDFERLAGDLSAVRSLLAKIEQRAKAIEIESALDALIAYEIALEEDDMEVLLIAA